MSLKGLDRLVGNAKTVAIVCTQFGDSGKGKICDMLSAEWADVVARGTGGANAGHTVVANGKKRVYHSLPASIQHDERVTSILGNGTVISPAALCEELDEHTIRGGTHKKLIISGDAGVVMPYHIEADKANMSQANGGIGSTGRGIGPAYTDRTRRIGIVMRDLTNPSILRRKLEAIRDSGIYGEINPGEILESLQENTERLSPMIRETAGLVSRLIEEGKRIAFEGAQGLLLSSEHGIFPYVTSSDCSVNGTASGVGISARSIDLVLGICKFPFMSKVGGGPFPTELGGRESEDYCAMTDSEGRPTNNREVEKSKFPNPLALANSSDPMKIGIGIRRRADEYGSTTGRPRRVGWVDVVAARYAARINGPMKLVLTKPDCLEGINSFNLCFGYKHPNGRVVNEFSRSAEELRNISPLFRRYTGYEEGSVTGATSLLSLPYSLHKAIKEFSQFVGSPVGAVSTGPEAHQTIFA